MGCNCGKKRAGAQIGPASQRTSASVGPLPAPTVVMYDVFDSDGSLVASYSNPVTARAESRRSNGNVVPRGSATTTTDGSSVTTEK